METHSSILAGESYGQGSLAGYSPWGCRESDTTEWLTLSLSLQDIVTLSQSVNRYLICLSVFQIFHLINTTDKYLFFDPFWITNFKWNNFCKTNFCFFLRDSTSFHTANNGSLNYIWFLPSTFPKILQRVVFFFLFTTRLFIIFSLIKILFGEIFQQCKVLFNCLWRMVGNQLSKEAFLSRLSFGAFWLLFKLCPNDQAI